MKRLRMAGVGSTTAAAIVLACFLFSATSRLIAQEPGGGSTETAKTAEATEAAGPITYYVAPNGDDGATGTLEDPLLTPTAARDRIRADKKSGKTGPFAVELAEGHYPLTETFCLNADDSGTPDRPILWRGVGRAVLSGGIELTGWRDDGDGVWSCALPETDGAPLYFEQLFVNGQRAVRSRYPNEGFLHPAEIREEFPMDPKTRKPVQPTTPQELIARPGELDSLDGIPAEELRFGQLVVHHHWDTTRRILLGFDKPTGTLKLQGSPQKVWNPWRPSSLYYIENVRSAFDVPGEWFYDGGAKRVFYRPRADETLDGARFVAPRTGLIQLMTAAGTPEKKLTDVIFENIAFSYADTPRRKEVMNEAALDESVTGPLDRPGPSQFNPYQAAGFAEPAVTINRAERVTLRGCEISHTGEYGLWLKNVDRCRVERSVLEDLGAGGIRIGGVTSTTYNVVENNIIRRGGRFHASGVAVWIGNNTIDNDVTHNDISDFYYTGVSVGWNWGYGGTAFRNRIEFNRIHKIGQGALADMGGVYTLGTTHGTRVCNNVIYDIKSYGYGGWGLYTDEGSEGILMENNLVYDTTDGSFHQHYGKGNLIRNNILVDSRPHQIAATRVEPHRSFTFENNIVCWKEGTAFGYNIGKVDARFRNNLWWCSTGETTFGKMTADEWFKLDSGSVAADPLFVDPERRDYRLKPDSPALKLGFVPFHPEWAGLYGGEEWVNRAEE